VFLSAVSSIAGSSVQLFLYLAAGLLIFRAPLHVNFGGCVVVFLLSMAILAAVGMLAAALQLAIQKGSAVVWAFASGAWLMTGALFPVATLPAPLRLAAKLIPVTYCLDGM